MNWRKVDFSADGYPLDDSIRYYAESNGYYLRVNSIGSMLTWTILREGTVIEESTKNVFYKNALLAMESAELAYFRRIGSDYNRLVILLRMQIEDDFTAFMTAKYREEIIKTLAAVGVSVEPE